jgi:hypothetical protein
MYWIRHTILTWVERNFGFAVAEAYAGHEDTSRGARAMHAMATYSGQACPKWRPPLPPSRQNLTRTEARAPRQQPT